MVSSCFEFQFDTASSTKTNNRQPRSTATCRYLPSESSVWLLPMSAQSKDDDFCLECHWESFHLDGGNLGDSSDNTNKQPQWPCSGDEHHTSLFAQCDIDEACCDVDDCSFNCSSVCDGFVDCDESTICSVQLCENKDCENTGPACFDNHCFGSDPSVGCGLGSLLGLQTPITLPSNNLLPAAVANHGQTGQSGKVPAREHTASGAVDLHSPNSFFIPCSTPATQCAHQNSSHHGCHGLTNLFPTQNHVKLEDTLQMLGPCPDLSNCHGFHEQGGSQREEHLGRSNGNPCALPPACFHHSGNHHLTNIIKNRINSVPGNQNSALLRGACRSHHHCYHHSHLHSHPYSPFSRQSRSSVSSHFLSSPGQTPPPLEGGSSSLLTSPEFPSENFESHVCKWTTTLQGVQRTCGAVFSDEGSLQEHLVSKHMTAIDGAKGHGYYCCWEDCHRPDDPFSQKSKLQGHFLTHSNYKNFKCYVCGKQFARQATLDRHARSHRGEKPYKCQVCGKAFTDSSELKTHTRTHTGEKPFKCNYPGCNFETGDSSNMSSHKLTHGERKHKCTFPGCDKSFTRPDQLKRHMKTTHKLASTPFPSPLPDQFTLSPFPDIS